ncbi:MAG: methyltransferase [Spirochaetes bacterium]|nr:methyltransferase [Spirochaetota bacterium]
MNARELVYKTLEFDRPERVPRQLWASPWASLNYPEELKRINADFPADIGGPKVIYAAPPKRIGQQYRIGTYVDEWGCMFENIQDGVHGEVKEPLIKTWDDAANVRVPVELLSFDKAAVNESCRQSENFIIAGCNPRPFERIQFMRSSENIYMDFYEHPSELKALIKLVHDFNMKELDAWTDTAVDAISFMDDWGAQRALLIAPGMWREFFLPLYKDYISLAHAKGKKAFMHSDGYIIDIIPDLIDAGLDALNSQLFCMGLENLSPFKGRITFWGEIDRQHILPEGPVEVVKKAVRDVKHHLYANGGVIAQCEFGPGAKPEHVYAVFEEWGVAL